MPVSNELNNQEQLKDISFKELYDKTIGLSIGVDASVVFWALESRFGPEGTLVAIRTSLGWSLFGSSLSVLRRSGEQQCYGHLHACHPSRKRKSRPKLTPLNTKSVVVWTMIILEKIAWCIK